MKPIYFKHAGVTILEVLVSVLVVAIGMLGFATLQLQTLNTTQESYSRTQATVLLENVTDMVRSNADFVVSDQADSLVTYAAADNNKNWCAAPPPKCEKGGVCVGNDLILSNMREACDSLAASNLPSAKLGAVCTDRDPGDTSDNCNPSSKWRFYVSWEPTSRQDTEGTVEYEQNNNCQTIFSLEGNETCVIMELIL